MPIGEITMALLWIEGFEGSGTTDNTMDAYIARKYDDVVGTKFDTATGRYGGKAVEIYANSRFYKYIDNTQTIIIGFAFKCKNYNDNEDLLLLQDDSTVQIRISTRNSGDLRVERGTTTLDTTVALGLAVNIWYYIELKIKIDSTTGSYELRVNDINVLDDVGINTQETANAYLNRVCFFGDPIIGTLSFFFDDIYILDTTGSRNNDFLGTMKVVMLSPDGATAEADFTPSAGNNIDNIDDGVTVDDDTTYNESSTSAHQDIFEYEDTLGFRLIAGLMVCTEVKETDANDFTLKTLVRSNSTIHTDIAQALTSSYTIITRLLEDDPVTETTWSSAAIDAAEFGYEVG